MGIKVFLVALAALAYCLTPVNSQSHSVCGGTLTNYSNGGIFYKYEQGVSQNDQCIWTVTAGPDNAFVGLEFDLIQQDFVDEYYDSFLSIFYATEDGKLKEAKTFYVGDLGKVSVPSNLAFVMFHGKGEGKGFILYYGGTNTLNSTQLEPIQRIPAGERIHISGTNVTRTFSQKLGSYSTFVFQYDVPLSGYTTDLSVIFRNNNDGPTSELDSFDVWRVKHEGVGTHLPQTYLVQPIASIKGSASNDMYDNSPTVEVKGNRMDSFIAISRPRPITDDSQDYDRSGLQIKWTQA